MSDTDKQGGFWSTLTGIISGLTALLVAVTGLITVLNQVGVLHFFPPIGSDVSTQAVRELNQEDAIKLIESWLRAKEEAYSPPYSSNIPQQFLTGNRLERALNAQSNLKAQGTYRTYGKPEISIVTSTFATNENKASIEVLETQSESTHTSDAPKASPEIKEKSRKTFYSFEFIDENWKISESRYID